MSTIASFEAIHWQSSDGLRLYARDYATGQVADTKPLCPVICLHGLTRNSADFDRIAQVLQARGRRVLAVDFRGRGCSEYAARATYNAATYADDVLALMRSQGIERAVFIGTSLGAMVTMTLAARNIDAVVAAVINDVGPQVPKAALKRIGAYAGKPVPPMTLEQAADYAERIGKATFPRYRREDWLSMAGNTFRPGDDGLLRLNYDPAIIRTASPLAIWLIRPLLWRAWRKLAKNRPVLLLRGKLSDLLEADLARRMAAVSPSVRLVEVEDVGHAPDLSEPESQQAIFALLDEVP